MQKPINCAIPPAENCSLSLFLAVPCVNWKKVNKLPVFYVSASLFRTFHNCCRRQQGYYCGSTAPPPACASAALSSAHKLSLKREAKCESVCVGKKVLYLLLWFLLAVWYVPEVRALKFLVQHFSAPAGAFIMCVCAIIKTPNAHTHTHTQPCAWGKKLWPCVFVRGVGVLTSRRGRWRSGKGWKETEINGEMGEGKRVGRILNK